MGRLLINIIVLLKVRLKDKAAQDAFILSSYLKKRQKNQLEEAQNNINNQLRCSLHQRAARSVKPSVNLETRTRNQTANSPKQPTESPVSLPVQDCEPVAFRPEHAGELVNREMNLERLLHLNSESTPANHLAFRST